MTPLSGYWPGDRQNLGRRARHIDDVERKSAGAARHLTGHSAVPREPATLYGRI